MVQYIEASGRNDGNVDLERDKALVLRCQAGDSAAFAALYTRYEARLFRFCLRRLHDRQEAEDVTQEAFVKAWRAIPRFAGDRRFYPWLSVIAGNLCTDALRRRSRTAPEVDVEFERDSAQLVDRQPTIEEQVVAVVDGELLHRALGRLTDRHRRVLELREGSEWSYKEIARYEGVEVSAIETLVWRARQALKREFEAVSGSTTSLGAVMLIGGDVSRRWRSIVARHGGILHPGGLRLRDAAMALAVTSAVATSAVIPLSAPTSAATPSGSVAPSGAPSHVVPGRPGPTMVGGHSATRAVGGGNGHVTWPSTTGGSPGTADAGATPATGGGPDSATAVATPGGMGPIPQPVTAPGRTVEVPTPGNVVVPVVSGVGSAATSAVASLGIPVPTIGTVPVTGSGIATVLPGGIGATSGVLSTVVNSPGSAPTSSTSPTSGLLGLP